jgi:hypothetical protein
MGIRKEALTEGQLQGIDCRRLWYRRYRLFLGGRLLRGG